MRFIKRSLFLAIVFGCLFLYGGAENTYAQWSGNAEWQGRVDGRYHLTIRGRNARARSVSGQPQGPGRFYMNGRLPNRQVRVRVDRLDGRGNVRVIQQPSRWNNFRAVIEVNDPRAGADRYRVRVYWD